MSAMALQHVPARQHVMRLVVATTTVLVGASLGGPTTATEIDEHVSVLPQLAVNGVTAAITYDKHGSAIEPGAVSDMESFTVSSNTSVQVYFSASDFSGPVMLPADTRAVRLGRGRGGLDRHPSASARTSPTSEVVGWNPIYSSVGAVEGATFRVHLHVGPPVDAVAGHYTASTELVFIGLTEQEGKPDPAIEAALTDPTLETGPVIEEGGTAVDPVKGKDIPGG
jgi:hypothetical protein